MNLDIKRTNYIDKCLFSYISNAVFLVGITVYLYYFLEDYKDRVKLPTSYETSGPSEGPIISDYIRPRYITNWIYGFFIMLLVGFFISSYMCKINNS